MTFKLILPLVAGICLILAAPAPAQELSIPVIPEGKIRYLVTHNWSKKFSSLDYISKQTKERNEYMWGGSRSEWKEYYELYINPGGSKYQASEEKAEDDDYGYSWRKEVYVIRRDFVTGMTHDQIELLGKTYLVEDTIRPQDWKIMNDLKEVVGHVCMNAFWEDTLKKQKITVWFALDIPHSSGPDRLCGLPGLILEADVNDGALTLLADKIELQKLGTELDKPKKIKGKKVTEAGYMDVIKKHIQERVKNEEPWFWGIRYL